jgi:hypothetical protein
MVPLPLGSTAISLLGCLALLGPCVGALFRGPGVLAKLVVQVCELFLEARYPFVEVGRPPPGVRRALSCEPCFGCGSVGACLRLIAQLLKQPNPLDQSLAH